MVDQVDGRRHESRAFVAVPEGLETSNEWDSKKRPFDNVIFAELIEQASDFPRRWCSVCSRECADTTTITVYRIGLPP